MEEQTPKDSKYSYIGDYPKDEQLDILKSICNRLYIARNITLSEDRLINALTDIDKLFRDRDNWN